MVIVKGWKRDYVLSDKEAAFYRQAIKQAFVSQYTTDGQRVFKGGALSFIVKDLRYARYKVPGDYTGQVDLFEKLGFKVIKGRPKFTYQKGFRGECEVVTSEENLANAKVLVE